MANLLVSPRKLSLMVVDDKMKVCVKAIDSIIIDTVSCSVNDVLFTV